MCKLKLLLAAAVISYAGLLVSTAAPAALSAAGDDVPTKVACNLSAYVTDPDPKGTNIRSGPNKNASIIKTVPTDSNAVVQITGSSGGWFQVSEVAATGDDDRVLFKGSGWMHSSVLGMDVGNNGYGPPGLYTTPSKQSRVLRRLKPDQDALKLLACKGTWVQVQVGGQTGWLAPEGQCANPLTTCP